MYITHDGGSYVVAEKCMNTSINKAIRDGKYLAHTCQYLATFTPLKSKMLIFFRDVISLLARVVISLIDTATQEVPMKDI